MIGRLATLENIGELLWQNVTTGTPDINVAHYEAITNDYCKECYGLTDNEVAIKNPGGSLIFANIGAVFPDATYTVGTVYDDSGDGAITLDGELRSVVNSGAGDDVVGIGFSPANHALLVNLIADGSEGQDTFAYGGEWAFELDVSLIGYSGGYYASYVSLTNEADLRFSDFADAASVRCCGTCSVAMRRISPIRSFTGVDLTESETLLSPQPGQKNKTRDELGICRISANDRHLRIAVAAKN